MGTTAQLSRAVSRDVASGVAGTAVVAVDFAGAEPHAAIVPAAAAATARDAARTRQVRT
jgi:hypothetical protein